MTKLKILDALMLINVKNKNQSFIYTQPHTSKSMYSQNT